MPHPRLDQLFELVPPPRSPACIGHHRDVAAIAAGIESFGYQLPADVVDLSMRYGYGSFCTNEFYLTIHSIFRRQYLDIVQFNQKVFSLSLGRFPSDLTPWATMFELGSYEYENGQQGEMGRFFLDLAGQPCDWAVGLSKPLQTFRLGLVDFLIQLFQDRINPKGFPASFRDVTFIPNHSIEGG